MPHDNNGKLIEVGDLVYIPARVTQVTATEENYCNVTVETLHPMPPYESGTAIALNARQVVTWGDPTAPRPPGRLGGGE